MFLIVLYFIVILLGIYLVKNFILGNRNLEIEYLLIR